MTNFEGSDFERNFCKSKQDNKNPFKLWNDRSNWRITRKNQEIISNRNYMQAESQ